MPEVSHPRVAAGAPLPAALRRFFALMVLLTACSAVYTAISAQVWHLTFPWGLPLLWDDSRAGDFLVFRPGFVHFGQPEFWSSFEYPFTYPAPLGVLFSLLYKLAHPVRDFLFVFAAMLGCGAAMFAQSLVRRGVAPAAAWTFTLGTLAMCWPLWFELDTANIEAAVVISMGAGVLAMLRGRWWLGCILTGVAGSMKYFPLALLALALSQRRFREFGAGMAAAIATTFASLLYLGPTMAEAQHNINRGFALVEQRYFFSLLRVAPAFDHSLWMPVRFAVIGLDRMLFLPSDSAQQSAHTAAVLHGSLYLYLLLAAAAGIALYVWRVRKLPLLNQVLVLTVAAVLLPPLSLEYTLLHLLLPFALLCTYAVDMRMVGRKPRGLRAALLCFVPVFNSDAFLNHRYVFASEARLLGLAALLIVALRFPFADCEAAC